MKQKDGLTTAVGSFADMPTDLKTQIDKLEELFVVPKEKLKEISNHFVKELEKGLSKEGGSIVGCTIFNSAGNNC
jgi:hexokinase